MSVSVICSAKDTAVDAFGRPFFVPSTAVAVRSFRDEVNRPAADNEMFKHSGDFLLYELGSFDDSSGTFTCLDVPRLLLRGSDAKDSA